jgi:putative heme-binding domain-containing protein
MKSLLALASVIVTTLLLWASQQPPSPSKLELKPGDHVCIIGNTLAERMQHYGWLETLLHSRFPKHQLVVRNLGFAGDELTTRLRSANFGTPDEWLTKCKADVVFAFFGYNESFAGEAGLPKFKDDLSKFIKHTLAQKYNGKSAPRIVLFSPLAHENLKSPHLPDGSANNARLRLYSRAMGEIARAHQVPFVDLFAISHDGKRDIDKPLTLNGIHLSEFGDQIVARLIEGALFDALQHRETEPLERLRAAVNDKNFYWFQRYRTTDGYSIYGGRADLKFVDGQTNREVAQREMEVLDVMTANRDKRVWGVAQGDNPKVDDSNLPPFIPVKTNKPGKGPNGEHLYLSGEEAIQHMKLATGFKVNLFASEKEFPELAKPVQMSFDPQGRLWVAVWPSYPHWKPTEEMNDKLLVFEDTNGDGKADKCTTFADRLHNPTGFELWNGGVLIASAPNVWFLKDTNGDGKADQRDIVLSGIDSADTHHTANSFTFDPGGGLYFQEGTFHHTQVETPYTAPVRCANAGVFRYEPRTHKFETYISHGFANPHGHAFDRWGQDIVIDGTGSQPYHAALFSGHIEFPHKHRTPPQVYKQWTRPCPGIEFLSSRHFPAEMQGNLLVANVIGYQGILSYQIKDKGASFEGQESTRILSSDDPNFRPSDLKIGPDGAIYFLDWHNPIIGHMQHNLRDPSRDRKHGRVYRITHEGRELLKPVKIAKDMPTEKVLELLKEPEDRVRYRARLELSGRNDVLPALQQWVKRLNPKDPNYQHSLLEALWQYQAQDHVQFDLLLRLLQSPDFRVRAAAVRVLCYWRDRLPANTALLGCSTALALLRTFAADPHPRVRLEAVRAASFLHEPQAFEVVLIAVPCPWPGQGEDEYVNFTAKETMKTLEPRWKAALAAGKPINVTTEVGKRFLIKNTNTHDLLKAERSQMICEELLTRPGVQDEYRKDALRNLARFHDKSQVQVLLTTLGDLDPATEPSVYYDLVRLLSGRPAAELAAVRSDLVKLALESKQEIVRQMGFVALLSIDQDPQQVAKLWSEGSNPPSARFKTAPTDFAHGIAMLPDMNLRAQAYPMLATWFAGFDSLPDHPVTGRFIRIALPGKGKTLTLAEVEVYSQGTNVARRGKATQSATAHGGVAARALDGNSSGIYAYGGQTHTPENGNDPWWEVDLGTVHSIDNIVIYNRVEGTFYRRLEGFSVQVLGEDRQVHWQRTNQPAPPKKVALAVSGEDEKDRYRQAVMFAMTSVRGQEGKTFQLLSQRLDRPQELPLLIRALQRIPRQHWPKEQALPVLQRVLTFIRTIPTEQRTTPQALEALEFADALTTLLPPADAVRFRQEVGQLGVRVLRVSTLLERMAYDRDVYVMQAGRPVEIVFENTDLMPHNLVVTRPGALEEIGLAAEATATSSDAPQRHFVPKSDKILLASRLLQPREVQRLRWTAPTQPGVYPIVCTYPGHWLRMHAALYVVADFDAYQADPETYLTANPLPINDPMLKDRRPRTEWKLDDLAPRVADMKAGRSFGNGKQLFKVANCTACHKLDGVGNEFGPDLRQFNQKWSASDLLKHIVEPSLEINEKYQTWTFVLNDGKSLTGLLLEETADAYQVIENPLVKAEPVLIKKADVDERQKSKVSTMPKGQLDTLSREEILDLIAYLISRGDAKHDLFKSDGHGH